MSRFSCSSDNENNEHIDTQKKESFVIRLIEFFDEDLSMFVRWERAKHRWFEVEWWKGTWRERESSAFASDRLIFSKKNIDWSKWRSVLFNRWRSYELILVHTLCSFSFLNQWSVYSYINEFLWLDKDSFFRWIRTHVISYASRLSIRESKPWDMRKMES